MKRILLNILIILLMLIATSPTNVQSQKLVVGDTWSYETETETFNETAIDNIQVISGESAIATTVVETDRPTENDYHFTKTINGGSIMNVSIDLDITETLSILWISQSGGFPINSHSTFAGQGEIIVQTPLHGTVNENRTFSNVVSVDYFNGNPALALTTTESQSFSFSRVIGKPSNGDYLRFGRAYVISTEQSATDAIRNYTITPTFISLEVRIGNNSFYMWKSLTEIKYEITSFNTTEELIKSPNMPQAQLYQFDETNRLPLLIKQTEGAKIGNLGLNSFEDTDNPTKIVEYRLVQEIIDIISDKDDSPLIFIFTSLILIIFYRTYKKRRY